MKIKITLWNRMCISLQSVTNTQSLNNLGLVQDFILFPFSIFLSLVFHLSSLQTTFLLCGPPPFLPLILFRFSWIYEHFPFSLESGFRIDYDSLKVLLVSNMVLWFFSLRCVHIVYWCIVCMSAINLKFFRHCPKFWVLL